MKKKITALCLCVALLAVAVVGASLAYFTDTDEATNTFTVGNVKIELLESSLHRENAGVENGKTSTSELWSDVDKKGTGNTSKYKCGDTFYTDAQIEADAANYKCDKVELTPGESYHKMPYVKNTGYNDAYIRICIMIPADLDTAILNSSMYTSSAIGDNSNVAEFTLAYNNTTPVERDGVKYNVYTFTRVEPLKSGEMTYWNVWGTIHMDSNVTNEKLAEVLANYTDNTFPVLVEADAIQADPFENATAAWSAFDAEA